MDPRDAPSASAYARWATLMVCAATLSYWWTFRPLEDALSPAVLASAGKALLHPKFMSATAAAVTLAICALYVAALWPRRRTPPIYGKVLVQLAAAALLTTACAVAAAHQWASATVTTLGIIVALTTWMLASVARVAPRVHSGWMRVPFSLFLSVSVLVLLDRLGNFALGSPLVADIALVRSNVASMGLAIIAALAGGFALRYHEFAFPGFTALFILLSASTNPDVASPSAVALLATGAGLLLVSVLAAIASAGDPRAAWERRRHAGRYDEPVPATAGNPPTPPPAPRPRHKRKTQRPAARSYGDSRTDLIEGDSSVMRY